MEDIAIPAADDPDRAYKLLLAQYDVPAFLRRDRRVKEAIDALKSQCRKFRDEALLMARLHLGQLKALAGGWSRLHQLLPEAPALADLELLEAELQPQLKLPPEATSSLRVVRRALGELTDALTRFGERWRAFVAKLDLTPVNEQIAAYNRYYVIEKECFVRSPRVARQGFAPMPPITHETVLEWFPVFLLVRS
jgi:hypothetical protein